VSIFAHVDGVQHKDGRSGVTRRLAVQMARHSRPTRWARYGKCRSRAHPAGSSGSPHTGTNNRDRRDAA